ncbi:hypothetical protein DUNSADRAFT_17074 [Dunaliella salina]|uniref:Uncharacterized protein n=1 Tax=Dunaliella salina TaxID=3046 RepID=A0ABQ7G2G7_DUNSA|nr:hypothetical protein DUNSADRAFT_17074 [Dunaliella salina]|eukprot:KAF5828795.1 hypothetical protein DUNSADRAFT_17074 [Dunaliella salina]
MMEACEALKLPAQVEDKHYPKAWWIRARLRVQIKNGDGTFIDPEITSKQKLLLKLAQQVPKTPLRLKKGPMPMNILAMPPLGPGQRHGASSADADGAGKGAGSSAPASGSGGSNKKKKGRK